MGAEMTVEVIERFAQCAYYLGNLLDDVARVYREGMEEEQATVRYTHKEDENEV